MRAPFGQSAAAEMAGGAALELQGILQEILKSHSDDKISELCETALQLREGQMPVGVAGNEEVRGSALQLQSSGVSLWNKAVALKSAGAITLQLNAQMRYLACSLMVLTAASDCSPGHLQKQITMATKTGRAWLDCENSVMAETTLAMASECYERLRCKYPGLAKEPCKLKDLLRLLSYRAEAAVRLQQQETACGFLQQAKQLLLTLETEVPYVCLLCYDFGYMMFSKAEYQHSVVWLKESYDIGRGRSGVEGSRQARTLRLLANAFLKWDGKAHWQKALNAVGLANSEHFHASGILLKVSILLDYDPSNDMIPTVFEETLKHPDLSVEMALRTIKVAKEQERGDLALFGISKLCQRYKGTPYLIQVHLLHLELLLALRQEAKAMQLMEDIIIAHNQGEPLDIKARQQLHLVLWHQASLAFESSEFKKALSWYNYSLSLFPPEEERNCNIAKLQRNRCACYLNLEDYVSAREAVQSACHHDSSSPQTHFLAFKLAILTDNQDEAAAQCLRDLAQCAGDAALTATVTGLISLAAQLAFEHSSRDLAVQALSKLVKGISNTNQTFTALRCLLRIELTIMDTSTQHKISSIRSMLDHLTLAQSLASSISCTSTQHKELNWLLKVAWNLALKCEHHHKEMAQLFSLCHQLCSQLPAQVALLKRQKSCQLMAAAAMLQVASATQDDCREKEECMLSVLEHVSICYSIHKELMGLVANSDPMDPTPAWLGLYEFEAKLSLGHSDTAEVLAKVSVLVSVEAKTLETMAALCLRATASDGHHNLGVRALQMAIDVHMRSSPLDGGRLSRCYHSLVQLVMSGSGGIGERGEQEEAWKVLSKVLDVLDSTAKDKFPEIEIVWFMSRAWNCGIHLHSALKCRVAEQWCSLAMRFLKHLSQHKDTYEDQMSSVYSEVLQKLQRGN